MLYRFGEGLDPDVLEEAAQALQTCDLFMTIGTSSVVYPAAGFAAQVGLLWTAGGCPPIQTAQGLVCKNNATAYCRLQLMLSDTHTLGPCARVRTMHACWEQHSWLIHLTSVCAGTLVTKLWCT